MTHPAGNWGYDEALDEIVRLQAERDAEAENCRLMQDRVTRLVEANHALMAERDAARALLREVRGACVSADNNFSAIPLTLLARIDEVLR